MNLKFKKCSRMRLTWRIIEAWKRGGDGKKKIMMVP
jgi:hypothetical protein